MSTFTPLNIVLPPRTDLGGNNLWTAVTFYLAPVGLPGIAAGTEMRRTWIDTHGSGSPYTGAGGPSRTVAIDEVVTAAIQATADYIAQHAAQEAIPLATQSIQQSFIIPEPTFLQDS